ncbi:hypothetical protein C8T65DRAFT_587145, partial [Cerioporus squamosus]
RGYDEHLALISKFEAANYSGDETDAEPPRRRTRENRFRIIECWWMSDDLRNFLRRLDADYLEDWECSPTKRSAGGSAPRERVVATPRMITEGTAVVGLWRNCYNEDYLKNLKPHDYRKLQIIESNYDFRIRPRQPEFVQGSSRG